MIFIFLCFLTFFIVCNIFSVFRYDSSKQLTTWQRRNQRNTPKSIIPDLRYIQNSILAQPRDYGTSVKQIWILNKLYRMFRNKLKILRDDSLLNINGSFSSKYFPLYYSLRNYISRKGKMKIISFYFFSQKVEKWRSWMFSINKKDPYKYFLNPSVSI